MASRALFYLHWTSVRHLSRPVLLRARPRAGQIFLRPSSSSIEPPLPSDTTEIREPEAVKHVADTVDLSSAKTPLPNAESPENAVPITEDVLGFSLEEDCTSHEFEAELGSNEVLPHENSTSESDKSEAKLIESGEVESTKGTEINPRAPPNQPLTLNLPPRADGYPTTWFLSADFQEYILPLYQRGWEIVFKKRDVDGVKAVSLVLENRPFVFKKWNDAIKFIHGVSSITEEEKHHPHSLFLTHDKGNTYVVTMSLHTHSAIRPDWINRDNVVKLPGVTRRDIRLAVLLENLYKYAFNGTLPKKLPPPHLQPHIPVMHKILNASADKFKKYCTNCGGLHIVSECHGVFGGVKKYLPYCPKCRQRHWPMSVCPWRRNARISKPSTPCPNCGGDHWLADCRKPQLPPGEAEAMAIPIPGTN